MTRKREFDICGRREEKKTCLCGKGSSLSKANSVLFPCVKVAVDDKESRNMMFVEGDNIRRRCRCLE